MRYLRRRCWSHKKHKMSFLRTNKFSRIYYYIIHYFNPNLLFFWVKDLILWFSRCFPLFSSELSQTMVTSLISTHSRVQRKPSGTTVDSRFSGSTSFKLSGTLILTHELWQHQNQPLNQMNTNSTNAPTYQHIIW